MNLGKLKVLFFRTEWFKLELVENKLSKSFRRDNPPSHSLLQEVTQFSFKVHDLTEVSKLMQANEVEIILDNFVVEDVKTKILIVRDPDGNFIEFVQEI